MTEPNDEVEKIARVMCAAHGFEPDTITLDDKPMWRAYKHDAKMFIAAYRLITGQK